MQEKSINPIESLVTRRDFLKKSSAASLAAVTVGSTNAFAQSSEQPLKVGLIGCGNRGNGAAYQCLVATDTPIKLWAMGDLFPDGIEKAEKQFKTKYAKRKPRANTKVYGNVLDKIDVAEERKFVGWDAYKKVIDSGVDIVILAAPPAFRPPQFEYAVNAGKHIFMEKPVAVDPVGIRSIIKSAKIAQEKNLTVVAGTQRRHQAHYLDIIQRIHDGAIGELVGAQCYWNMGELWVDRCKAHWEGKTKKGWTDMEWQCRNWLMNTWSSGDHVCEQHVHNIDIVNWAFNAHPVNVSGMGGRQSRTDPMFGNVYDHFALDFVYPNGIHVTSMCKQVKGSSFVVAERIIGTKGYAYLDSSDGHIAGENEYKPTEISPDPYVQEHADLIASIRSGAGLNEGVRIAESTLSAIMGRMSTYTGRALKWDWVYHRSKLDIVPKNLEFGDLPLEAPAIPGETELV